MKIDDLKLGKLTVLTGDNTTGENLIEKIYKDDKLFEGSFCDLEEYPEHRKTGSEQVDFARLVARRVISGYNYVVFTHSDFIIKEFNNFIVMSQEYKLKKEFMEAYNHIYTPDDFTLKADMVKCYYCEKDGEFTECEITKYGMLIPSIEKAIDDINNVSNSLSYFIDDEVEEESTIEEIS